MTGSTDEPEYGEEAFIVDEDANVILSRAGLGEARPRAQGPRLRPASARATASPRSWRARRARSVAFFSNLGTCYVCRIHDVPPSTGYGDPVQKLFKLGRRRAHGRGATRSIRARSTCPRRTTTRRARASVRARDHALRPGPPLLAARRTASRRRAQGASSRELNEGDEVIAVLVPPRRRHGPLRLGRGPRARRRGRCSRPCSPAPGKGSIADEDRRRRAPARRRRRQPVGRPLVETEKGSAMSSPATKSSARGPIAAVRSSSAIGSPGSSRPPSPCPSWTRPRSPGALGPGRKVDGQKDGQALRRGAPEVS